MESPQIVPHPPDYRDEETIVSMDYISFVKEIMETSIVCSTHVLFDGEENRLVGHPVVEQAASYYVRNQVLEFIDVMPEGIPRNREQYRRFLSEVKKMLQRMSPANLAKRMCNGKAWWSPDDIDDFDNFDDGRILRSVMYAIRQKLLLAVHGRLLLSAAP